MAEDGAVKLKINMDISDVDHGVTNIERDFAAAAAAVEKTGKTMTRTLQSVLPATTMAKAVDYVNNYRDAIAGAMDELKFAANSDAAGAITQELVTGYDQLAGAISHLQSVFNDDAAPLGQQVAAMEDAVAQMERLGLGAGDALYDEMYGVFARLKAEEKSYLADLAKTPEQRQREAERLAAVAEKVEAARQKELQRAEAIRQAEAAEQAEAQRLAAIANTAAVSNPQIVAMVQELEAAKARLADLSAAGLGAGYSEVDYLTVRVRELTAAIREYQAEYKPPMDMSPWQRFKQKLVEVAQRTRAAATEMRRAGKSTQSFSSAIRSGVRKLVGYGIGLGTLRTMFTAARRAIADGISTLAQYDSETNTTLTSLKSALNSVKMSWAAAFAPVATAVAPYLSQLCSMLVTAANYVAMFFAVLGGKSTYKGIASGAAGASGAVAASYGAAGTGVRVATVDQAGQAAGDYAPAPVAIAKTAPGRGAEQPAGRASAAGYAAMGAAIDAASESAERFGEVAVASYASAGAAMQIATGRAYGTAEAITAAGAAAEGAAAKVADIAAEAKKAVKQFSGLDEMNIWQVKEESGGSGGGGGGGSGGGGGGGLDVSGGGFALEELPVDQGFADKISGLKAHLDDILAVVGSVGAGLLTWKVAKGFGASLKTCAALALDVGGAVLLTSGNMDAWANGASWGSIAKQLGGTASLAGGLGISFGKVGAEVGGLIGSASMVVTAFGEMIKTGELTNETFAELEIGIAGLGITLSLLTGSWIPLLVAGLAGLSIAAAKFLGGDFTEQVKREAHQMGIDAMDEGIQASYDTLRKCGVPMAEAAEAVGVQVVTSCASAVDTSQDEWLAAFRRMGYTGTDALAESFYASGMTLQEACIAAGVQGGMSYGEGVTSGAAEGMSGLEDVVDEHAGGAATAAVREAKRAHRDTSAAFRKLREDSASHVEGLEADVSGAYSGMADTVAEDSSSMETDNDTSWSGMKELLQDMAGKMQDKVVSAYAAMGEKISTVTARSQEHNSASWTAMEADANAAATGIAGHAARAWANVPEAVQGQMSKAASAAREQWSAMQEAVTAAGSGIKAAASSAWSEVANAVTSRMSSLKSSAAAWGRDICANLAAGMQSGKSRVSAAASSVAGTIRSYLHFSVPDKGPLSDADEYGGDFIQLLSDGMTDGRGRAARAAAGVASAISDEMDSGGTLLEALAPDGMDGKLRALTERLQALAEALEALAAPLRGLPAQAPALAGGTVLPPRAVYTDGPVQGLGDMRSQLRQMLGMGQSGERWDASYTFVAQLDRRTLFKEVIAEGKLARAQSGRNPFALGG